MRSPTENRLSLYLTRKTSLASEISPRNHPSHSNFEMPPIDCYLTRHDVLSEDRSKHSRNVFSKNRGKDISYLYDSHSPQPFLSPILDAPLYPLPSDISELKLLMKSSDYSVENLFKRTKTSKPYGRKDAVNLSIWLTEMHKKYLDRLDYLIDTKDIIELDLIDVVESIYLVALKESIKQIAVNCIERATMIYKIFDILSYTWKRSPDDLNRKIEQLKLRHLQDLAKFKSKSKEKYEKLEKKYEELQQKLEGSIKEKELLKHETGILKRHLTLINTDIEANKANLKQRDKKQFLSVGVQTDIISDSESSSEVDESSSEISNMGEPETHELSRMLTRQKTFTSEKRAEHLMHLKKHLDLSDCAHDLNIEDLYQYISTQYCDFFGWVDGFRLAAELMRNKDVKSKEIPDMKTEEIENKPEERTEVRSDLKRKAKDLRISFHFKPNQTIAQHISENSPIEQILQYLAGLSIKKISKISNMPTRKLMNSINYYIHNSKLKDIDQYKSYVVYVYSLLFQKYSLKPIANRKFKELIASCIKHVNDSRVQVFLKMLGGWPIMSFKGFWLCTTKICIRLYEFMTNDKTGIVIENPSGAEATNYPATRALECIKSMFDQIFIRSDMAKLRKNVEALITIDPVEVNRFGLIDLHRFVLISAEAFQEYAEKGLKGAQFSVSALTDFNYITWEEANILIRVFNPKRELVEADRSNMEINQTEEIELEHFQQFCIARGVLRIEDYNRFFSKKQQTPEEILNKISDMKSALPQLLDRAEGILTTYSFDEWDGKLDDITIGLKSKSQEHALKQWMILYSEYQKLQSRTKGNFV